jgi:hypothetical protein
VGEILTRTLKNRVGELEKKEVEKLERKVFKIYRRYGGNSENIIRYASAYEKEQLFEYLKLNWSKIVDAFMQQYEIFSPILNQILFEQKIYPIILSPNPREEIKDLVSRFDFLYSTMVNRELWQAFGKEHEKNPKFGKERWDTWTISDELKERFDTKKVELEVLKNKIREKMLRAMEQDVHLLKEEGSHEAAQELKKELFEIKKSKCT